jgi:hypothetical protein
MDLAELMTTVVYRLPSPLALYLSSSLSPCHTFRYSREARRDHYRHTSIHRQADSEQGSVYHHRARHSTSPSVITSSFRLSCSLAWCASRRWGSWGFQDRPDREATCLRLFAALYAARHAHARVSDSGVRVKPTDPAQSRRSYSRLTQARIRGMVLDIWQDRLGSAYAYTGSGWSTGDATQSRRNAANGESL